MRRDACGRDCRPDAMADPDGGTAAPQVTIAYGDAQAGDAALVHARDILVKSQALEELGAFLTPLRLPADLAIRSDACGGAFPAPTIRRPRR